MNTTPEHPADQRRSTSVTTKRALAATAAALALASVAACGPDKVDSHVAGTAASASPSPTERLESMTGVIILERAQQDFLKAPTVKITGHLTTDGQKTDFTVQTDTQGNCKGSFTTAGQGTTQVLRTSGQTLVKPDAQALAKLTGPAAAELGKDRWLRLVPGDAMTTVTQVCDRKSIPVFGDGTRANQVVNSGTTTVNGVKVVEILAITHDEGGFTGHVSTETPARPVRVESKEQDVAMDFADYGTPLDAALPPADQIIDLAALKKSAGA
ncbi:hypothetical protein F7Q99_29275 [Streptomyces kaniharaensis]|uniref:Lipoprotein n=1 Tax=Streptomyces kaniharaensis TaxID=212423 RepID=A0A6N7L040_9ACTN|nr:hypothetical protein [Streptomyces kaniharaensis]MQS16209.1 hypothetical protein [Streptomyces kaniharaensis]